SPSAAGRTRSSMPRLPSWPAPRTPAASRCRSARTTTSRSRAPSREDPSPCSSPAADGHRDRHAAAWCTRLGGGGRRQYLVAVTRIAIGSDHAGFLLKAHLIERLGAAGHDVADHGTDSTESVDYPSFCAAVG